MRRASIELRGANTHNLASVDLTLPHGEWIGFVGPSGSGKTSLVFDTLVREGGHRFLRGLSARARQYFGKLGRADVRELTGLPPAVAVGERAFRPNARSTVGTLTGTLDLLRLLFARLATDPTGTPLTRSHFSFNHPLGACENCQGLGVQDRVDPALLVADPTKSLRERALVPTLKNGYTVYSQVTLDVLDTICRAHGFDVTQPWNSLTAEQQAVIFYGTKALKVPFGKHTIESRMKWEGITARPREEGYYRGLVPVIEETLQRNRNPNILRFVRSAPCETCGGSRLARPGREARIGQHTLPDLLGCDLHTLQTSLAELPNSPVLDAIAPELSQRLGRMLRLGLGHLALGRESTTLSGGEGQRLRLAAQLSAGLCGMLFAMDEPTLGLHPSEQAGLAEVLEELRTMGNTLAVVEHDPDMVRHVDRLVRLGPGAGTRGGRILSCAAPELDPLGAPIPPKAERRAGSGTLRVCEPTLHNLQGGVFSVHLQAFNVVCGPSGAGKSSLVFGTLLPALNGEPGGSFARLEGAGTGSVRALDARPIGRTSRSTPATWSGLFDIVRKRFAATDEAKAAGLAASHFSYNTKQGRCPTCEGLGVQKVGLHLLENVEIPCDACAGGRYAAAALQVQLHGKSIAEVLALTVDDAVEFFANDKPCATHCQALQELGLGHLSLGAPSNSLSRGESQRVKLATLLGSTGAKPTLLLLDEPDRGLHPSDVELLLHALNRLVDVGHTVLAISHHRHVWAAADALVELRDGRIDQAPCVDWTAISATHVPRQPAACAPWIELRGVRTNNLKSVDVRIPRGRLTVLCGVSGSGKSSLAFDTLAAEAWHRFAESLPFEVRRHVQRMPRPELDACSGLGPTLSLRQFGVMPGSRSTVATQSELGPLLRLLYSRAGTVDGEPTPLTAEHFSPDRAAGACASCRGYGTVQRCTEPGLVNAPEQSLLGGAMGGTKPGAFFTEPDGQYLATLRAALDPGVDLSIAWQDLPEEVRRIALHGSGDRQLHVSWKMAETNQEAEDVHEFKGTWDGFFALVEREALRRATHKGAGHWQAPLSAQPCEDCAGSGLTRAAGQVRAGELTLPELLAIPMREAAAFLRNLAASLQAQGGKLASAAWAGLRPEIESRLDDLLGFGLGHLPLGRATQHLSASEHQRLRLAGILRSGLDGLTLVLDEPSAGLQASEVAGLCDRLRKLCAAGNTIVVVEHDERVLRKADHLIELGPGAGAEGGQVLETGMPEQVLAGHGPTAEALRRAQPAPTPARETDRFQFVGIDCGPLHRASLDLPRRGFVTLEGPSGSGKTTLLQSVIGASFETSQVRGARSVAPAGALDHFKRVHGSSAQSRGGTLLGAFGLIKAMQRFWFERQADTDLPLQAFSFQSPKGRCTLCTGTGKERVALDFLADLELPCPACDGKRYRPEVLAVRWNELTPAAFLELAITELRTRLPAGELAQACTALSRVGLAHLAWGRDLASLSGGELQRVALAKSLREEDSPALHLMDDPTQGLHPADVVQLRECIQTLVDRGDLVVAITASEHLTQTATERLSLDADN